MYNSFQALREKAMGLKEITISVAVAEDKDVLLAVKTAEELGMAKSILVGDEKKIRQLMAEIGFSSEPRIINEADSDKAALVAANLVRTDEAQVLMKGLINSSNFLRAVLHPDFGLRTGRILSHLAAFDIPGCDRLVYHTDGGMNIAPGFEEKKQLTITALEALHSMGIEKPNVAVLAANEQVNPKMPATVDALALVEAAAKGELPACVIEGPIAMDVAVSAEAAKHKGIDSKVAGQVDLFVVPTIEAGNIVGKTLVYYAKAKNAGVILGAKRPVVMVSRSDDAEAKLNSLALACLIAAGQTTH